jgi:hypothetical protein
MAREPTYTIRLKRAQLVQLAGGMKKEIAELEATIRECQDRGERPELLQPYYDVRREMDELQHRLDRQAKRMDPTTIAKQKLKEKRRRRG